MKFKKLCILLAVLLTGCSSGSSLPVKDSTLQGDISIYPEADVGYVGDPMPFFDNGKMNIFYLQDGRNTSGAYHPINLMQTENYYEYEEKGTVVPFSKSIFDPDYALGTGSVIKDKDGLYHFYYTGHNSSSKEFPYNEKIQHATSSDLLSWTKHPEHGFYGTHDDFRDPYVLYMEEDNCYWMLVTTRRNNKGVLDLYKSTDLITWNYDSIFYENGNYSYNMECPTLIKYNSYWYLSFSEQGSERVTRYRYTDSLSNAWKVPTDDRIDDKGFYAGRLEKDDQGKMYAVGWCATKVGEIDQGDFDWGGNLVVHEIVQKSNGELGTKLIDGIKNKLSNKVGYKFVSNKKEVSSLEMQSSNYASKAIEPIGSNKTRIEFKLRRKSDSGACGLTFGCTNDNTIGTICLEFNIESKFINFYNEVYNVGNKQSPQLSIPMENAFVYDVQIIIDNQILVVYVNNKSCLTTRIYDMRVGNFAFYVENSNVAFKEVNFYE